MIEALQEQNRNIREADQELNWNRIATLQEQKTSIVGTNWNTTGTEQEHDRDIIGTDEEHYRKSIGTEQAQ